MARRNYYIILGVPRGESPGGIRSAYRRLARKLHPDLAGENASAEFKELSEAYATLSDPSRRREYDRRLELEDFGESSRAGRAGPARTEIDLLVPEPISILGNREAVRPSFDELLERLLREFTGLGASKAERPEALNFEVVLDPSEAARGGIAPIGIPVFRACPACGGAGWTWSFPCADCDESGRIMVERTVAVRIPPQVPDGSVFDYSLDRFGIRNLFLRLHVRIGG